MGRQSTRNAVMVCTHSKSICHPFLSEACKASTSILICAQRDSAKDGTGLNQIQPVTGQLNFVDHVTAQPDWQDRSVAFDLGTMWLTL